MQIHAHIYNNPYGYDRYNDFRRSRNEHERPIIITVL